MREELAMSKEEYEKVMAEIRENHAFGGYKRDIEVRNRDKSIKYVRPNWDMRDGMCFSIKFDGLSCGMSGKEFGSGHTETTPLFDRIMEWLNEPLPPPIIFDVNGRG